MKALVRNLAIALPLLAVAASPPTVPTPTEIVAQAPPAAWAAIAADDLLVLDLDGGQRVVIALAPAFAPVHVANIKALARSGWFAGTTVNRVQDNYVVQWGDASGKKPLPEGIVATPPAEYTRPLGGLGFRPMTYRDAYAAQAGHADGWPVAREGDLAWLPHCYAMVGAGRDLAPDTGTGAELYAVIGHAPRHLDRNMAMVGRVVAGIEALTALPRGTEALGFYGDGIARPAIVRARIAADMVAADRPVFEVMRSGTPHFVHWIAARANRSDAFFVRPAGALDICNAMPPVRAATPR